MNALRATLRCHSRASELHPGQTLAGCDQQRGEHRAEPSQYPNARFGHLGFVHPHIFRRRDTRRGTIGVRSLRWH